MSIRGEELPLGVEVRRTARRQDATINAMAKRIAYLELFMHAVAEQTGIPVPVLPDPEPPPAGATAPTRPPTPHRPLASAVRP